jgi:hypothetical protein
MKQALVALLAFIALLTVLALAQSPPPQTFAEQRLQLIEKKVHELEIQVADLKEALKPKMRPAKP